MNTSPNWHALTELRTCHRLPVSSETSMKHVFPFPTLAGIGDGSRRPGHNTAPGKGRGRPPLLLWWSFLPMFGSPSIVQDQRSLAVGANCCACTGRPVTLLAPLASGAHAWRHASTYTWRVFQEDETAVTTQRGSESGRPLHCAVLQYGSGRDAWCREYG